MCPNYILPHDQIRYNVRFEANPRDADGYISYTITLKIGTVSYFNTFDLRQPVPVKCFFYIYARSLALHIFGEEFTADTIQLGLDPGRWPIMDMFAFSSLLSNYFGKLLPKMEDEWLSVVQDMLEIEDGNVVDIV